MEVSARDLSAFFVLCPRCCPLSSDFAESRMSQNRRHRLVFNIVRVGEEQLKEACENNSDQVRRLTAAARDAPPPLAGRASTLARGGGGRRPAAGAGGAQGDRDASPDGHGGLSQGRSGPPGSRPLPLPPLPNLRNAIPAGALRTRPPTPSLAELTVPHALARPSPCPHLVCVRAGARVFARARRRSRDGVRAPPPMRTEAEGNQATLVSHQPRHRSLVP